MCFPNKLGYFTFQMYYYKAFTPMGNVIKLRVLWISKFILSLNCNTLL